MRKVESISVAVIILNSMFGIGHVASVAAKEGIVDRPMHFDLGANAGGYCSLDKLENGIERGGWRVCGMDIVHYR